MATTRQRSKEPPSRRTMLHHDDQKRILLLLIQNRTFVDNHEFTNEKRIGWTVSPCEPVCSWSGIECDNRYDLITAISLSESNLSTTLPTEIGELLSLRHLLLHENDLYGSIPQSVADLPNLESVNLSGNRLTGSIPLLKSRKLRRLKLGFNLLSGTIGEEIGVKHVTLTEFDAAHNSLTGSIPTSLSTLQNLIALDLSRNQLSGCIPSGFGSIPSLRAFILNENYLMGAIPPSFGNDRSPLEQIWLHDNLLSGTIPARLSLLRQMSELFLYNNKLTGTIPPDLCHERINTHFYGNFQVNNDSSIKEEYYCDAIACPTDAVSPDGMYPCSTCPKNKSSMYKNPYLGKIGDCDDWNPVNIVPFLTNSNDTVHQQSNLTNRTTNDYDETMLCDLTGVTCNIHKRLINITLPNRGLIGTIPPQLGFLPYLQHLDLSFNELTGFLPSDLRFAPLSYLDVSGNKLRGIVPPMLCLKQGLNGNGRGGDYNCDNVACGRGFYNGYGRRLVRDSDISPCVPCSDAVQFLGSTGCHNPSPLLLKESTKADALQHISIYLAVFASLSLLLLLFTVLERRKSKHLRRFLPIRRNSRKNLLRVSFVDDDSSSTSDSSSYGNEFHNRHSILEKVEEEEEEVLSVQLDTIKSSSLDTVFESSELL